jgi:mRNA interferase HigB
VISKKRIQEAKAIYPNMIHALEGWYQVISKNSFKNYAELKKTFGSIDKVGMLYVFDIGGNKVRLIASIHFDRQRIYIRHILNHKDYDKGLWKK